ncbi:hypothetical protein L7F22_031932 [Adiantum nelumboides]|nr:hypothetical protein [Adiantum nelumboides]
MVVNNSDGTTQENRTRIAGILGVYRRNIAAANNRLELKDDEKVVPLSACQRQSPQSNIVTSEVRDLVYVFWSSEMRVSPNKTKMCRKRIERKSVVKHPVHLNDDSQRINFVEYDGDSKVLWAADTSATWGKGFYIRMQSEGRLVVLDENRNVLWASSDSQQPSDSYRLVLQNDVNAVVYNSQDAAVWNNHASGNVTAAKKKLLAQPN